MSRKTWIILGVIVVLIAGGGAWYYFNSDRRRAVGGPRRSATGTVYEPLPTDHAFGNPKSGVTVIEYASPTCPVCANFMMTLYPKLKSDYIDKGRIFYVYRTFLRNPDDASAEKLARCLPKDKYMAFMDLLFRSQQKWDYEYGVPSPDGVHVALLELVGTMGMSPGRCRPLHRRHHRGKRHQQSGRGRRRQIQHRRHPDFRDQRSGASRL